MSSLRKPRGKIYKFLHVFSMGVLIINMSMLGVFFVGEGANAMLEECYTNEDCGSGYFCNDNFCAPEQCTDIDEDGICDDFDLCIDVDKDGYGKGSECIDSDCNDNNENSWQTGCFFRDEDGDNYYKVGVPDLCAEPVGSMSICYGADTPVGFSETSLGPDCDDTNPDLNETCDDGIVPNPSLDQSCGLDMVLVIDSSSSMYGDPLKQEKDAFLGFINSFLPETPARIALVDFNTTATLLQGFTASTTLLENAINSVSTTPNELGSDIKYTNWEDALDKAHGEFSNGRPEAPDLLVFASDGNPNYHDNPPVGPDKPEALSQAIDAANAIKTDGIRIIALGIGETVLKDNLVSISGPNVAPPAAVDKDADVILTDFAGLATTLSDYATELCGGTITVKKYVNGDLTAGWDFTAIFDGGPVSGTTDDNGMVNLDIDVDGGTSMVDVEETLQPEYILDDAFCKIDEEPIGTFDNTDSVDGISVSKNDVVYCEFYNIDKPQTGTLTMCKQEDLNGNGLLDNGEPTVTDPLWHFMIEGMDIGFEATTTGCVTAEDLPYGDYTAFEEHAVGWNPTGRIGSSTGNGIFVDHDRISVTINEGNPVPIIYFLNQRQEAPTGSISGCKYEDVTGNGIDEGQEKLGGWEISLEKCDSGEYSSCEVFATTTTEINGESDNYGCYEFTDLSEGFYKVREATKNNWSQTYPWEYTHRTYYNIQLLPGDNFNTKDFANYHEPYCGDNIINNEEECDDGPEGSDNCTAHCEIIHHTSSGPECGNGIVETGEACDDGNLENGDGCTAKCEWESGPTYFTYTNQGSGVTAPSTPSAPSTPTVKGEEGAPNLTISKAVAQTEANAGDKNISYKIVVANNGNLTAFGVVVKDTLPEGMTYVSDGSTSKTWEIGDLAPGESKDILYLTNIGKDVDPVVLTNTATVSASNFGEVSDSAEVQVKEIKVLAETGFSLSELMLLILALSSFLGSALYLKKKYLKA